MEFNGLPRHIKSKESFIEFSRETRDFFLNQMISRRCTSPFIGIGHITVFLVFSYLLDFLCFYLSLLITWPLWYECLLQWRGYPVNIILKNIITNRHVCRAITKPFSAAFILCLSFDIQMSKIKTFLITTLNLRNVLNIFLKFWLILVSTFL